MATLPDHGAEEVETHPLTRSECQDRLDEADRFNRIIQEAAERFRNRSAIREHRQSSARTSCPFARRGTSNRGSAWRLLLGATPKHNGLDVSI